MTDDAQFLVDQVRGQVARAKALRCMARIPAPHPTYKRRRLARARFEQVAAAHRAVADRFNAVTLLAAMPVGGMQ